MSHIKPFSKFGYLVILLLVNYHSSLLSTVGNWILYVTNTSGTGGQPPSYAVLPITIPSSGTPTQTLSTISLSPSGPNPMNIAITPNSELAVVVASDGVSNEVALINLSTNAVVSSVTNAGNAPVAVAISPDGTKAYVPNLFDNTVSYFNIRTNNTLHLDATIPVGIGPNSVAIGPANSNSSNMVYVGNGGNNITPTSVTVINITNNQVVATITGVGTGGNGNPTAIAIHPNGNVVYVVSYRDNHVAVINPATNTVVGSVSLGAGSNPRAIVISSDGTKAYVSNFSAGTVSVLNLSPNPLVLPTVGATITGFSQPSNLAITPDANTIYVSDPAHNRLAIVNTTTNTITGQITEASANLQLPSGVPFFPGGFVVTPDQAPTAQYTATNSLLASVNAAASLQVTFDASGSSSPVGTIVSYAWDFGDGTTTITSNPIITHTYSHAGIYTVSLTVTNSGGTSTAQIFTGRTVSNNGGPSASLTFTILVGPSLTKSFSPAIINPGGMSTLTINLNYAGGGTLSLPFTDTLPDGLLIDGLNTATTGCGGTNVISNTHTAITLASGATIPASGSCTINATVTSSVLGTFDNTIPAGALIVNGSLNPVPVSAYLLVRRSCLFSMGKSCL